MNNYEFFYGVMSNAITKEADEVFTCEAVCLKHALIKLARYFASLPDYRLDRYQVAVDYAVNEYDYKELNLEDFHFLFYYTNSFQQYTKVENDG